MSDLRVGALWGENQQLRQELEAALEDHAYMIERVAFSRAISTLCWFLRWVLDEDERRVLRRQAVFMLPTNEDDERLVDSLLAKRREEQRDRQRAREGK